MASPTPPTPPTDGAPQGLQAPWRLPYLEASSKQEPAASSSGSFLLDDWNTPDLDTEHHVIVRSAHGLILLNAFPYATGHLLVALGEPRPTLLDYTPAQRARLWSLVDCAMDLLQRTLEPQGVNLGVNQGKAAGAGVPSHLHVHLVPRWGGDVNFMTSIGAVRVIPASLELIAERYRATWAKCQSEWAELLRV